MREWRSVATCYFFVAKRFYSAFTSIDSAREIAQYEPVAEVLKHIMRRLTLLLALASVAIATVHCKKGIILQTDKFLNYMYKPEKVPRRQEKTEP